MTVYLLQIFLIPLLALIIKPSSGNKSNRIAYAVAVGFVLVAVAAVRSYTVGVDTEQFCRAYLRIGVEGQAAFELERYELGFTALCLLLNYFTSDFQILIVAASMMSMIPVVYLVYKCSSSMPLSFFIYVTLNLYFGSMNIMRQAIAIGIIALAVPKLLNGKRIPYLVAVVCATLFHQSAPIALLLIPLSLLGFTGRTFSFYLLAAAVVFILSSSIVSIVTLVLGQEALYDATFMSSNYFGALIQVAVTLVCCALCTNYFGVSKRAGVESDRDALLQHAMMLWLIFMVFAMQVTIIGRLSYYFSLFAILALPEALERIPKSERGIVLIAVCAAFFLYFVVIGIARPEWFEAIPYTADLDRFFNLFRY